MNNSYGGTGSPEMTFLSDFIVDGYPRLENKALRGEHYNRGRDYTYFVKKTP